jgi:hypothetical protein
MRTVVSLIAAALVVCSTVRVRAHDPWEATAFDRDPSGNALALNTNRGILFSTDAGKTWHYLCRGAINLQVPLIGVTARSQVMVGHRGGMSALGVDGCGLHAVSTPMSGNSLADLQRDPTSPQGWYATTTKYGQQNGLYYSSDDGLSWSALGALEQGPFFKGVRPSRDGKRIYVVTAQYYEPVGMELDHTDYAIRWSDDRGQSWTSYPVTLRKDDRELVLLGVDPTNADRVFAAIHVCRADESCLDPKLGLRKDTLLVSHDRGKTWSTLLELAEVAGFAVDPKYIWVGDWQGGLWRMNLDGSAAQMLAKIKPGCLHKDADDLFVCGTDLNGFMLARSGDDGVTLTPVAQSGNTLGNPSCPPDPLAVATLREVCEQEWTDLCRESFFDDPMPPKECSAALAPVDAGPPLPGMPSLADAAHPPPADAGGSAQPAEPKQGNGCAIGGSGGGGWLLLTLWLRRRQRAVRR